MTGRWWLIFEAPYTEWQRHGKHGYPGSANFPLDSQCLHRQHKGDNDATSLNDNDATPLRDHNTTSLHDDNATSLCDVCESKARCIRKQSSRRSSSRRRCSSGSDFFDNRVKISAKLALQRVFCDFVSCDLAWLGF
ncbi:hypothetical protein SUGI_0877840 [Cryptomeria japonica]|nr:hypothetical protein SUGI_0877840 [Cryptomeria japonica]